MKCVFPNPLLVYLMGERGERKRKGEREGIILMIVETSQPATVTAPYEIPPQFHCLSTGESLDISFFFSKESIKTPNWSFLNNF
jgi:hypothetical protein